MSSKLTSTIGEVTSKLNKCRSTTATPGITQPQYYTLSPRLQSMTMSQSIFPMFKTNQLALIAMMVLPMTILFGRMEDSVTLSQANFRSPPTTKVTPSTLVCMVRLTRPMALMVLVSKKTFVLTGSLLSLCTSLMTLTSQPATSSRSK